MAEVTKGSLEARALLFLRVVRLNDSRGLDASDSFRGLFSHEELPQMKLIRTQKLLHRWRGAVRLAALAAAVLALLGTGQQARAQIPSQMQTTGNLPFSINETLTFNQVQVPDGFKLTGVTVKVSGTLWGINRLQNLDVNTGGLGSTIHTAFLQVDGPLGVSVSTPVVDYGQSRDLAPYVNGDPFYSNASSMSSFTFGDTGGIPFIGAAPPFPAAGNGGPNPVPVMASFTFTDAATLAAFVGMGTLDFDVTSGGTTQGIGPGAQAAFDARTNGMATVMLNFELEQIPDEEIPEPATLLLFGLAIGGVKGWRWYNRRRKA
jgi:hypothetical protein